MDWLIAIGGDAVAIGLYRAVGFAVEGVKRDALRVDGGRFDLVVMALHRDGRS